MSDSPVRNRILPPSRSSACGPVSWPPSASRIACCSTARRSTATIAPAGAATFVVAVECATPTSTCFCTSMGTGPEVTAGFDVALTELDEGFVVRTGSPAGSALVDVARPAGGRSIGPRGGGRGRRRRPPGDGHPAGHVGRPGGPRRRAGAPGLGGRRRTLSRLHELHARLPDLLLHQRRAALRPRRHDLDRGTDLGFLLRRRFRARSRAARSGRTTQDRYRQWLTHKFSTWWDQFGSSGCVGCGRCIAWCPVGIDVREELAVIAGVGPVPMPRRRPGRHAAARRPALRRAGRPRTPARQRGRPRALGGFVTVHVDGTTRETADTVTLHLRTTDRRLLAGRPGQFVMAALPAFSAAPISVSAGSAPMVST